MTPLIVFFCSFAFSLIHAEGVPRRIVTLAPGHDETLIALGLQTGIVGVTTSSDYLGEVQHAERVGSYVKPNIEKIIALKPDIVFAAHFAGQQSTVKKLSAAGIRVVTLDDTQGLEAIFAQTELLGKIFEARVATAALLARMRAVVAETKVKADSCPGRPRVYVETGSNPLFTCGQGSFIHEMIEIAGGRNIAGGINQAFPRISSEFVLQNDPEVIILPYMGRHFGKDTLKERPGWENISAIRNDRVFDDLGSNAITIPSPGLILSGLPEIFKRIHPESAKEQSSE